MSRPLLLDLFCGAGGAAMGYHRAGFDIVGIDIAPQPNYPFTFVQGDALELAFHWNWSDVAAVHASPPCPRFSAMTNCRPGVAGTHPDLITPTRYCLQRTGLPWVIENVPGSPLRDPVVLCGQMFGLALYRHRLFESNVPLEQPGHPRHIVPASKAGHWRPGTIISVSGHVAPVAVARDAMGIQWTTRDELSDMIPPAYTEHIGRQLLERIMEQAA